MKILLGFLPFAVFAGGDRFGSTLLALTLAAMTAAVLTLLSLRAKQSLKLLDLGATLVFGGLALYTVATHTVWSMLGVRLCADLGLFAIVGVSLIVRQPFTIQYAKEEVPEQIWASPEFLRVNYRLSAIWCAAFAAMVLGDIGMLRGLPLAIGVAITLAALSSAAFFTTRARR
jgi:intracellular septation protein A